MKHSWAKLGEVEHVCRSCGFVASTPINGTKEEIDLGIEWTLDHFKVSNECTGMHGRYKYETT